MVQSVQMHKGTECHSKAGLTTFRLVINAMLSHPAALAVVWGRIPSSHDIVDRGEFTPSPEYSGYPMLCTYYS